MAYLMVLLVGLSVPAVAIGGYLLLLALMSRATPPPVCHSRERRFVIVVPAHNEERGIARTVENLLGLNWPRDRFRALVVADNCSDATAARAVEAGAEVLVRVDPERRGKGYALERAFEQVLTAGGADAVVVIDADTIASPNLLSAFAARLERGALAVQAEYAVLNPDASWRTRLMTLAFALFHDVRSRGRERLRLSCGLRGNGMCFASEALRRVPHRAFSLVEDIEYGIRLGLAGIRVHYAAEASVCGEMVAAGHGSASQRQRWEGGRLAMLRAHTIPLLRRVLLAPDRVLVDLALDLLVPPLSWITIFLSLGTLAAALLAAQGLVAPWVLAPWLSADACVLAYVGRGLWISRLGARSVATLLWAPVYVAWKLALLFRRRRVDRGSWIRTAREGEAPANGSPRAGPPPAKAL